MDSNILICGTQYQALSETRYWAWIAGCLIIVGLLRMKVFYMQTQISTEVDNGPWDAKENKPQCPSQDFY